jgi:glycerol uptake facilitator-like aquaporin
MYNYIVEFIGTIFFVYVILATGNPLAIGAALALVILLAKNTSGGHINPAVSLAMASSGALPSTELFPYMIAQFMGALVAYQIYMRFKL